MKLLFKQVLPLDVSAAERKQRCFSATWARRALSTCALVIAIQLYRTATLARTRNVMWSDVTTEIQKFICTDEISKGSWGVSIGVAECGKRKIRPSALHVAVQLALDRARPLLASVPGVFSIHPDSLDRALTIPDQDRRNREVATAYLNDPAFCRVVFPLIHTTMLESGVKCIDCMTLEPPIETRTDWMTLAPYVGAFVEVDDVLSTDGEDVSHSTISFHICSGAWRAGQPAMDPVLVRGAFVVASRSNELRHTLFGVIEEIVRSPTMKKLKSAKERATFIKGRIDNRLQSDTATRTDACRLLSSVRSAIDIRMSECDSVRIGGESQ